MERKIEKYAFCLLLTVLLIICLGAGAATPGIALDADPPFSVNTAVSFSDAKINGAYDILEDTQALNGTYVFVPYSASNGEITEPWNQPQAGVEFVFSIPKDSYYYIWFRYRPYSPNPTGSRSWWIKWDGDPTKENGWDRGGWDSTLTTFDWCRASDYNGLYGNLNKVYLSAGPHTLYWTHRQRTMSMDALFLSSDPYIIPGIDHGSEPFHNLLPPDAYPLPAIIPPANEHPRLLFRAQDIPTIMANYNKAQNAAAKRTFESLVAAGFSGIPSGANPEQNYYGRDLGAIEAMALSYALFNDTVSGQKAVNAIKTYLPLVTFPDTGDPYRPMGHVIFTASEVYDWCYDLLSSADKLYLVYYSERIAKHANGTGMEIGYPPKGQGAITGHGSEAQLLRDLLSLGVATYDEYPDIYNYIGGRLFAQYIEPRDFWYYSHTQHQGSAYGNYRFYWDMWAAFIIKAMSGVDIYNSEARFVPYEWIYTRRPDGQLFRAGDDYIEGQQSGFWQLSPAHFMAGNYYGDEYLKHEALRINPNFASFGYTNSSLTPVYILLFNDPDLGIKTYDSLPYSKYFPSPAGYMVARTGWNEGAASADVLATMKVTEYWGSNHHHLEAGSFQLYYKGILASNSGFYDSYGTSHDYNYNKRSISSNTLTIFDPNESFSGRANDGGQRLPANAAEPSTMAIWMQNDNYRTGQVLGQEFGPDKNHPEYTYIKGDITKAYSNKVSEVLRSMVFLPLDDPYHPAALIVMDKITSRNASFKKSFLLHMQQEPALAGSKTTVLNTKGSNNGKMVNETLLPKNALVEAIGGPGRQFMVNGVNYPFNGVERMTMEAGWGRVEISPSTASLTDYFLNVMTVCDANGTAPDLVSTLLEGESWVGAVVADHVAIFALDTERIDQPITFTIPGNGVYKVFIAGISEGTWVVSQTAEEITATAEGGAIYFQVGSASNAEEVSVTVSPKATTVSISGQIFSYNQLNPANIRLIQGERLIREITTPPGTDFSPLLQDFAITGITPGIYDLVITKPGHTAFTLLNVEVGSTGLDLTLDTRPEVQLISLWGGDINGDGIVNSIDLTYLLSEFNRAPLLFPYADIDGNGLVNSVDLTYLLAGFNKRDVVIEYAF